MANYQDLNDKCDFLEMGGEGPKTLVDLLASRPSWREDKLEEAYYKATNPTFRTGRSNFRHLVVELLEYGLIKETQHKTGYRFQLNDTVWGQDTELFQALNTLVYFYHENPEHKLRADANLNTFLKRVTNRLSGTRYKDLGWTSTYPIAGFIISKLRDFSQDQSLKRFSFAKRSPDQIRAARTGRASTAQKTEGDLFSKTRISPVPAPRVEPPSPKGKVEAITPAVAASEPEPQSAPSQNIQNSLTSPQMGLTSDTPPGLPEGAVKIIDPETFWPPVENALHAKMLRPSIFADRNALILEMHVTATRTQRIMLGVVKKAARAHLLAFSLCGGIDDDIDLAAVFESAGLDPSGVHPQILSIDGERFVGVVGYLPLKKDAPFYEVISASGKLADRLEAEFWQVDAY